MIPRGMRREAEPNKRRKIGWGTPPPPSRALGGGVLTDFGEISPMTGIGAGGDIADAGTASTASSSAHAVVQVRKNCVQDSSSRKAICQIKRGGAKFEVLCHARADGKHQIAGPQDRQMVTADLRTPSIASLPSQLVAPRDRPTDTDERRHAPAVGEVFRVSTPAGRDSRLQISANSNRIE